jgi:tRNA modification GTPase
VAYDLDDTIAAIASASGGAARGIVRISGQRVLECLEKVFACDCGSALADITGSERLSGQLRAALPIGKIPCCVYLWPTHRSYTREPAAEIHTFGSAPVLESALECVCASGARLARPGEFTLRAFLAGRLDLTQAEAVLA